MAIVWGAIAFAISVVPQAAGTAAQRMRVAAALQCLPRLLVFLAVTAVAAIPENAMAQERRCTGHLSLKPKADAIKALSDRLTDSIEPSNCRNAAQFAADYRALMKEAGDLCARESYEIHDGIVLNDLFGDLTWSVSRQHDLVLACESAGVIPLRTSQASCPLLAEYENEIMKLQREFFRLKGAERSARVCREIDALKQKSRCSLKTFTVSRWIARLQPVVRYPITPTRTTTCRT